MSLSAASHQGLHCLPRHRRSLRKEIHIYLEIITWEPSMYSVTHPKFTISNQEEGSMITQRVKVANMDPFSTEMFP